MSTADHVTCCCADTLAEVARLTAERDRARALAIRLEAEAAQPYLPAGPGILIVTDLRAPENGTETARTPPTTPDPSDKGTL